MIKVDNLWLYDCEIFKENWIVVFIDPVTDEELVFHNDNYGVAQFLDTEKWCLGGYNTKGYDKWILKAIYHGADNATLKELNDFIIAGNDGWNSPFLSHKSMPFVCFDLMDDLGTSVFIRLKEIEGNLGMDIRESTVPFDIDRPLTPEELEETIKYCKHDVRACIRLMEEREDYLQTKIDLGAMKNISAADSLSLTNAKLTALYLNAKFYDRQDEFITDFPENLIITKYPEVIEFFYEIDYEKSLDIDIAGVPHKLGWGGLHGAIKCYMESSTKYRKVVHIDAASFYPALMIYYNYLSRNVPHPEDYREVFEKRIEAKALKQKKVEKPLKLVLNTTFGASKNPHNNLFDPRMANAVCIGGQLFLIDLIEKLEEIPSFKLIQSNTDGLIVSYDTEAEGTVKATIEGWQDRTKFHMGFDYIEKIIQKDVNNYVLRMEDGEIDVKGGYVSNFEGGDFKNKSLVVVHKAIVNYLLDGIPPETTINECSEPWQFQMISKAGKTYDKVVWHNCGEYTEVQNVNRVYAAKDPLNVMGTIYKIKTAENRRDKIANLPEHCFIDNSNQATMQMIDKAFYIDMAQKRSNDYLGIEEVKPPKKERKKKMANAKEKPTEEITPENFQKMIEKKTLYQKLMDLQNNMDAFTWQKDGKNTHQKYLYITEKQYKNNFKLARAAAGLLWKMEEIGHEYIGNVSDKMHLILTQFRGRLIDPDTGGYEEYLFSGSGSDNGDKALYKAYTGGLKFFLASNYLVAEENDPEGDEEEVREDKPKFVTPEGRESIKEKITDQNEPATEEQLEAIKLGIELLNEEKIDTAEITELFSAVTTKAEAEALLDALREMMPE